ncbi:hypothetical protein K438DRAFT_1963567 [Mycena galopus ATCC 62051]|nr:hypothetical protein K438DRAFT_1963567 [Mycena galopus ATCC 62051]
MKVLFLLPFFAAVQAGVVPAVDTQEHFHSIVPSAFGPQGKNVTINGVLTYVSLPKEKYDPATAVLLLTDVFGLPSPDNLLLTYAPDYLNGDAIPRGGDVAKWIVNHGEAQTTPPLLAVIGPSRIRESHKSLQQGIVSASHVPIEINNAELDTAFTPAFALKTDAVLGNGQYLPGYSRNQFDGVGHGFAVRADPSDPGAGCGQTGSI